jgi:subtilase family serine protease
MYDSYYDYNGIAVTVASGDFGTTSENTAYPAASPYIVAVGGTAVTKTGSGSTATYSEAVWGRCKFNATNTTCATPTNCPVGATYCTIWEGSGSGCSNYEGAPFWQSTYTPDWSLTGCAGWNGQANARSVADIAAAADPLNGGGAIYISPANAAAAQTNPQGWYQVGGTSQASPIIAGMYALAGGVPKGTLAASNLYQRYYNAYSSGGATHLNDITSGSNWDKNTTFYSSPAPTTCPNLTDQFMNQFPWVMCQGYSGYDGPTGLGTPNGLGALAAP